MCDKISRNYLHFSYHWYDIDLKAISEAEPMYSWYIDPSLVYEHFSPAYWPTHAHAYMAFFCSQCCVSMSSPKHAFDITIVTVIYAVWWCVRSCLSVCDALTFESLDLDLERAFLVRWYVFRISRSSSFELHIVIIYEGHMKVTGSRSRSQEQKCVRGWSALDWKAILSLLVGLLLLLLWHYLEAEVELAVCAFFSGHSLITEMLRVGLVAKYLVVNFPMY